MGEDLLPWAEESPHDHWGNGGVVAFLYSSKFFSIPVDSLPQSSAYGERHSLHS